MDGPHVVIGWWGGTGGALAHDLVLRGLRVTLLERGELLPLVPRFGQRLYRLPGGLGRPLWVDAARFNLADHLRSTHCLRPLTKPAPDGCETLGRRGLDPARPMWEAWFLPGLPERQVGLFLRAHHALVDGVAGVAAFGALLELTADAATPVAAASPPGPPPNGGRRPGSPWPAPRRSAGS